MKQSYNFTALLYNKLSFLFFFLIFLGFTSCSENTDMVDLDATTVDEIKGKNIQDVLEFTEPGLYPEGIAHDRFLQRFLVTSVTTGDVGAVSYSGEYMPFIQDNRIISAIGLKVDDARKRILVAGADPGVSPESTGTTAAQQALLGIYDLRSGANIHFIDLGALRPGQMHFANDIALDNQGNAYVTDSF